MADVTGYPVKSVYRYFKWLIQRNWIGRNKYGRYYFRGIDRVHEMEGWQFGRAAIMQEKDLKNIKAFMAGVVLASLAKTREGGQREQSTCRTTSNRSKHTAAPISLSVLADTLEICESTAYKLRKLAHTCGYVNNEQNLSEIINWTPDQLIELKEQGLTELPVERLGYAHTKNFRIDRIRYRKNKLFVQEPNNVKAFVPLKSRKGLSKYSPIDT